MTPAVAATLPLTYRFLRGEECERLSHRAVVEVLCGSEVMKGTVSGFGDATMAVTLDRTGAVVVLDLDDPDFWPDGESRDRRPPMDSAGEFVAIKNTADEQDEGPDLSMPLRASVRLGMVEQDVRELREHLAAIRKILADRFGVAA